MSNDLPYHNPATMREKHEALSNDQAQHSTYLEQAAATVGQELGGRFAHLSRGQQHIVGTTPNAVPRLPSNSPWSSTVVPDELPLGYSIDQLPPEEGYNPPESGDYSAQIGADTPNS